MSQIATVIPDAVAAATPSSVATRSRGAVKAFNVSSNRLIASAFACLAIKLAASQAAAAESANLKRLANR